MRRLIGTLIVMLMSGSASAELRVSFFAVDASPKVGTPLAYDPTIGVQGPLSCRGIVLSGSTKPIVLCAVDWIGIANESHLAFRERLAAAVGTTPDRVSVHTLHQHDAPRCDFSTDRLLIAHGVSGGFFDTPFAQRVIDASCKAARTALAKSQVVTHLGVGEAVVEKVASNRRILGSDGKVKFVRYTACRDPKIRAMPTGTIDEKLKLISFWNGERPIAALTYYATHPQSYYRTGLANPDFPGMARNARQKATGIPHVHFNGAGGNIGAGKWNDGSKANRQVLADRVARGMANAWNATKKTPVKGTTVAWKSLPVRLPPGTHLKEPQLLKIVEDKKQTPKARMAAASNLVWLRRCKQGDTVLLSCLTLGNVRIVHMPGELFVEYQLAAQQMRKDLFVAMAAYGDYAPGYIGTKIAYSQGGYETSARASRVAPEVEGVLMQGLRRLLDKK